MDEDLITNKKQKQLLCFKCSNNHDMVLNSIFYLFILTNWLGHFKTKSSLLIN